ncbi:uncharacterized protein SCHCODRAFT_02522487 [Schizophyllum commune H4-8]|uniref:Uncharacterized protein n=1 Tax=Schizophyllum commune (strain H4-8 / FGSC 9210) TaxID=578458 RepID=D8PUM7_SCHCM|nr:uncharacterized protein SCHCODRAFT_02522487 [Schizophyllum commune H4-8]KAI5899057.1 hypothetical protein SCHCODRAFT_02522487 [Schizophyllum commune H4-8]
MGIPSTSRTSKPAATKPIAAATRKASTSDKDKRSAALKHSSKRPSTTESAKGSNANADPDKFTCKRCGALVLDCKNLKVTELLNAPRKAMQDHKRKCSGAPHPNFNVARSPSTATSSKPARTSYIVRGTKSRRDTAIDAKRPAAAGNSRPSSKPSTSSAVPSRPTRPKPKAACTKAPSKFDLYLREIDEAERARKEAEARANAEFIIDRGRKRRLEAEMAAKEKEEKATMDAAMEIIYGGKSKKVDDEAMPAAKRQRTA